MTAELAKPEDIVNVLDEMLRDISEPAKWREALMLTCLKDLARHVATLQARVDNIAEVNSLWDGS